MTEFERATERAETLRRIADAIDMPGSPVMAELPERSTARAQALRALADFIERYPEIPAEYLGDSQPEPVWFVDSPNQLVALVHAAQASGAELHMRRGNELVVSWHDVAFAAMVTDAVRPELDRWRLSALTGDGC